MAIYVLQEHDASTHHFDLRLEHQDVLKSWAIPKGLPEENEKNLAIRTEDHEMSFADFEGKIPENQYGAGEIRIKEKGKLEIEKWGQEEVRFKLKSGKTSKTFVLVPFKKAGEDKWLIIPVKNVKK